MQLILQNQYLLGMLTRYLFCELLFVNTQLKARYGRRRNDWLMQSLFTYFLFVLHQRRITRILCVTRCLRSPQSQSHTSIHKWNDAQRYGVLHYCQNPPVHHHEVIGEVDVLAERFHVNSPGWKINKIIKKKKKKITPRRACYPPFARL